MVTDRLRGRKPPPVELFPDLPAAGDSLAVIDEDQEWQRIRLALDRLPPIDQEIIALRFGASHTHRTIAALMGLSEANVAQRLRRALRKMRATLEGEDES
jgi:RNA polymerase sigma factor (sigma-70 family)